MQRQDIEELNERLQLYKRQLEEEKKINAIYQAQIRYARERESAEYQREIDREVKLQQIHLGYESISQYKFERLVATSEYQFEKRTKTDHKTVLWQRPQGLLRQLIKALMIIPRGLIRLCMTKIQRACTTIKKASTA